MARFFSQCHTLGVVHGFIRSRCAVNVNVNLRKLLSAHKSHVRKVSLFTGAIPIQIRNNQTSRLISVPGQYPRSTGLEPEATLYHVVVVSCLNK